MFRPRVIPVLLLKNRGLVKSVQFKKHRYIGDPINAVKIFNDLKADELAFLDITAGAEGRTISYEFVKNVGEEANMPFSVGGGITKISQIREIIACGAEKVVIGSQAALQPDFIREAADTFGSSTIVVCIDVRKNLWGKEKVYIRNAKRATDFSPEQFAIHMEQQGAGEIIIQSITNDGMMNGYDLLLTEQIARAVGIPVVALGGAGKNEDFHQAVAKAHASAVAAGSMFVYHGPRKGILINYPEKQQLQTLFHTDEF
jgi:imidazole glycerol-phosphate synthase subunit HisF